MRGPEGLYPAEILPLGPPNTRMFWPSVLRESWATGVRRNGSGSIFRLPNKGLKIKRDDAGGSQKVFIRKPD